MKKGKALLIVAASSFASGYLAGLLYAPESGQASRQRISDAAQVQRQRIAEHLHSIEEQLSRLERDLHLLGQRLGNRLRDAVPHREADSIAWDVDPDEVTRELRGMPRK